MIANEQQYRAAKKSIADLENSLLASGELRQIEGGIDPVLLRAHRDSIRQMISTAKAEIERYESALDGSLDKISASSLEEIGNAFVTARLAYRWTQRDLANRLGLKEQQIQRYESELYRMASLQRLADVARALKLTFVVNATLEQPEGAKASRSIHSYLEGVDPSCFPISTMKSRGWLPWIDGPLRGEDDKRQALGVFFERANLVTLSPMLNKRSDREIDEKARCALLAWQARVKQRAREEKNSAKYKGITAQFVRELVALSTDSDGPAKAIELLREAGIRVIIERHLPHTLLDGAAMLLEDDIPVVGLTLRLDRVDNFWFVLLHELGHIVRHWTRGLEKGFLDEEGTEAIDELEKEADEFSRNALIPDEIWNRSFVRYTRSGAQIKDFARLNGVSPAIVAGRLRREKKDYTLFSDLVGNGEIRKLFQIGD